MAGPFVVGASESWVLKEPPPVLIGFICAFSPPVAANCFFMGGDFMYVRTKGSFTTVRKHVRERTARYEFILSSILR